MRLCILFAVLFVALSSPTSIPQQLFCVGQLPDPTISYKTGLICINNNTESISQGGSYFYNPHPLTSAVKVDPTLFPLMDLHFKSLGLKFYRLAAEFISGSSLYVYDLYYITDKGLLKCEVQS
jgi:hypothetical protein